MKNYEMLLNKGTKLSLIGLGYVGLPIAIAFAKKIDVIGFDVNEEKINKYKEGFDPTNEVGNEVVKKSTVEFTSDPQKLKECLIHIIAVPTPIKTDNSPDLSPIIGASKVLGENLTKGSIVVYESTVYPGVTEDICVPILEQYSGLKYGIDFKVGYSPERINPGDREHRLENIVKIVSGMDDETLLEIAKIYELVVKAGVFKAKSIKVAEAAKVIENSQRDINIAFMNELSIIFGKLGLDTHDVLEAAGTKWNFLPFRPGLVGGHCIGVDPYYLTFKANEVGYQSEIILAGRKMNDNMGKYIVESLIKTLVKNDYIVRQARVGILGLTFKEDCPDIRNSKVVDIVRELESYSINPIVFDSMADEKEAQIEYGISLSKYNDLIDLDVLIVAVAHNQYRKLSLKNVESMFQKNNKKIIFDIKGTLDREEFKSNDLILWRL